MYIFIVNPIAGNGRGSKLYNKVITDPRLNNLEYKVYFTEYTGHAE